MKIYSPCDCHHCRLQIELVSNSRLKVAGSLTHELDLFSENFSNGDQDRRGKWAGSGRLALKWLYLRVRSRSQGCRVTLTAGATPVEGRRGFRWRVETALALATFSCSRVREDRGDGVKHSTTPDGQGVTTRPSNIKSPSSFSKFPRNKSIASSVARSRIPPLDKKGDISRR